MVENTDALKAAGYTSPVTGVYTPPTPGGTTYSQGGDVKYNSNTGALLKPGESFTLPPVATGPAAVGAANTTSTQKASTPVITAQGAASDYQAKLEAFMKLNSDILAQQDAKQRAALQSQEQQKAKELADSEAKAKQQGIDIQKIQAQAQKTAADAKLTAAQSISSSDTQSQTQTGTGATPDNTGTGTPGAGTPATPAAQTGTDTGTSLLNSESSALSDLQGQKDDAYSQLKDQVASIMNGTFPLSASEQALVTATQASFDRQKAAQAQANQAYEGTVREANFRAGGEYTPEIAAGQLFTAISAGVSKIADIDAQAAKTVADLQNGFMKQDYDRINSMYDKLDKHLTDKSNSIKDLFDAAIKNEKDLRDYNEKVSEFKQTQAMEQQKQDFEVKKFAFQSSLDLRKEANDERKTNADIAKIYADMGAADLSSVQSWVKNIKNGDAKLSDVPKGLKSAVSVGLANAGAGKASDILQTTKKSLDELNDMVKKGTTGFKADVGTNFPSPYSVLTDPMDSFGVSTLPGSESAGFDAKLNQVKNDVVLPNLKLLHGLGRVTDREFQALQSSVTSLNKNMKEEDFKKELQSVTDTIDQKFAEQTSLSQISSNVTKAQGQGYTPDEIVKEYSSDPQIGAQIKQAQDAGYTNQEIVDQLANQ